MPTPPEIPAYRYNLRDRRNVWMNRSAQRFFGYSQAGLHQMGDQILFRLVHQDDTTAIIQHLENARALQEGESLCCLLRVWPRDGISPKFAKICHVCVEVEGGQCVEIEGYLTEITTQEFDIRKLLERAIPDGNLILQYQPICDLKSGGLRGYEALARLRRGDQLYGPGLFLPYLDGDLEREWVRQQIEQIGVVLDALPVTIWISINACQDILKTSLLADLLKGHRHLGRIGLEILESISLAHPEILEQLQTLNSLGLILKADDVGNDHAGGGLDRLLRHDLFSGIKVDGTLIRNLGKKEIASVTKHLLAIANDNNLETIAEWVANQWQIDWLIEHGCQLGQGEFYGMPTDLPFTNRGPNAPDH